MCSQNVVSAENRVMEIGLEKNVEQLHSAETILKEGPFGLPLLLHSRKNFLVDCETRTHLALLLRKIRVEH